MPCLNIAKLKVLYVDKGEPPIGMSLKEALQALANTLGLEIRVAHSPPYCSKHNPIEHRLFSHITRTCLGVVFHSVNISQTIHGEG